MRLIQVHQENSETAIVASKVVAVVKNTESCDVTVKTDGEDFEFQPDEEEQLDKLYNAILSELSSAVAC